MHTDMQEEEPYIEVLYILCKIMTYDDRVLRK